MKHLVIGPTSSAAPVVSALRRAGAGDADVWRSSAPGDTRGYAAGEPLTVHLTDGFHLLPDWSGMSHHILWLVGEGAELEIHR